MIHADDGFDIQVNFASGELATEDCEHAVFQYQEIGDGRTGFYRLLRVRRLGGEGAVCGYKIRPTGSADWDYGCTGTACVESRDENLGSQNQTFLPSGEHEQRYVCGVVPSEVTQGTATPWECSTDESGNKSAASGNR